MRMALAKGHTRIKNDILGKDYSLSITHVDEKTSRAINKKYRKKDKAANVLSFALRKNEGEIILCPAVIRRETKKFNKTFRELLGSLAIHGMLHLKGMKHSSTMEEAERKYYEKYFYRDRRGNLDGESRSGGIYQGRKKP